MRGGFAICQAIGTGVAEVDFRLAYADASLRLGEIDGGLLAVEEALGLVARNEERGVEAELHRLRGELLLQRETVAMPPAEAVTSLETALHMARVHAARGPELRAAVALARCWQRLGHAADARRLLRSIYRRFKEGAETADLKAARALLDASPA
jgi:hypothetical protein